jgi:hypothetical protein
MRKSVVAVALSVLALGAQAQSTQTLDCTSKTCKAVASWAPADASLTGCNLYITNGAGTTLPAISGTVTTPGAACTMNMPTLLKGAYTLNAKGVNAFGEGAAMATPLSLTTGTAPGAPSAVVVQ